ncbi:MmgE/PrpD family protein [Sedimentibacter saalensis]|uniref:MmgE/PrpD family protein n=1 Tax=Sedimentibacter saalensis TaxID=130788 RepID=UPI0028A0C84D|nr:MmgE/PrpD family protein [Sedimentibacter saalensis]
MTTASRKLGEFIYNTNYENLPKAVVDEAKLRIADVIGIGLSGSQTEVSKIEKFSLAKGGEGKATIWGTGNKTSPAYASLANGTMTFHLELDDVHRTSHTHPGVSAIPTAIALCEEYGLSGKELITAVVLGYDASIRVGMAVSPSIYVDRTFLAPGTLSVFGAAASASKLLKLDVKGISNAIGGGSYFGPTACYESFKLGAGIKDMIMGWGNYCGIYAAELAAMGFGAPDTAIEGDFGFCKTTSAKFDIQRLYNDMGSVYEIMNTGVKPYACCRQHHAAIDCMLELRNKYNFKLEDVSHVRVRTFVVSSRGNKKKPASVQEAKYSIPYIMAVALELGGAWRDQFTDELINDTRLLEFASKVDVEPDYELDKLYDEKWPSIVEIKLNDGKVLSARHDLPKGEPEFPCSPQELKDKFMSLATDAVSNEVAETIWNTIQNLENLDDVTKLTELLTSKIE